MKQTISALILLTISFSLFARGAREESRPTLVVATDCTWPPMEFIDENNEIAGFDIDLIRAIAEAGDFEVIIKNTAWDGIFAGLVNQDYDAVISSVSITDERKRTMNFSIPYINAGQVLIVKSETDGVSSLQDMDGQLLGAQIGTTGAMAIEEAKGVNLKTYNELEQALEALVQGEISGIVADTPIAAEYTRNDLRYREILSIAGEPFTEEYYGIAVAKGNTEVLDLINKGIKAVIDSGKDKELIQKWLR